MRRVTCLLVEQSWQCPQWSLVAVSWRCMQEDLRTPLPWVGTPGLLVVPAPPWPAPAETAAWPADTVGEGLGQSTPVSRLRSTYGAPALLSGRLTCAQAAVWLEGTEGAPVAAVQGQKRLGWFSRANLLSRAYSARGCSTPAAVLHHHHPSPGVQAPGEPGRCVACLLCCPDLHFRPTHAAAAQPDASFELL